MPKITNWAKNVLLRHDIQVDGVRVFRQVPWSIVYLISTNKGKYFLKKSHDIYSDEWKILNFFQKYHYDHIPKMLAYHPQWNCILLEDAGENIHELCKGQYCHKLMLKLIDYYADIQVKSSFHAAELNQLLSLNWNLENFPKVLEDFLKNNQEILIHDGISSEDFSIIRKLIPKIKKICIKLNQFKIPQTIEHGDLFDENFNFRRGLLVISDWADSCIGHPFFSFGFFIQRLQTTYDVSIKHYFSLKNQYLSHWSQYADVYELNQMLYWVNSLTRLRTMMSYSRIAQLHKNHDMGIYKGYLRENLLKFNQGFLQASRLL